MVNQFDYRRVVIVNLSIFFLTACLERESPEQDFDLAIANLKASGLTRHQADGEGLPWFTQKLFDPVWDRKGQNLIQLPSFKLTNQFGKTVTRVDLNNRIVFANFFYARCGGMCPSTMRRIKKLYESVGHEESVLFLSHTLTPDMDTPSELHRYQQELGIADEQRWLLLTGSKDDIYRLARENYYADTTRLDQKSQQNFRHSEHLYLFDREGYLRGIYNSKNPMAMKRAAKDYKALL
ncbi:SCO family protein [Pseudobacteriovorax antillogorgiicola]|uniref:Protein SCO1/2 n=1 Tax=Pseudobacteriovorax antillogorgiicola TaxID=1513793 RepID=A0A1Y6BUC1_9BACT|nr:SCO family protein [Pseudobacteriovorax antillogorgiicola]TCS52404.1 protein SCO1/2 [Pseudobacteriovorax antillogorgiicola]SMF28922.1 protein SCO1/2 [Pseudobacteriovorax antillogorgiicola]